ncbi:MAG: hypothetical protein WBV82_29795, partial [Myxococcaceae bacterium]
MAFLFWAVVAVLGAAVLVRVLARVFDFLSRHHVRPVDVLPFAFNLRGWQRSSVGTFPVTYGPVSGPADIALQFSDVSPHFSGVPQSERELLDIRLVCGALDAKEKPEDLAASRSTRPRFVAASGHRAGFQMRAWLVRRDAEAVLVTLLGKDLSKCKGDAERVVRSVLESEVEEAVPATAAAPPLQLGPATARLRLANDMQLRRLQGEVQSEELAPGLHLVYALQGEDATVLENVGRAELEQTGREQFRAWAFTNAELSRIELQQVSGELVRNATLVDNASLALLAPSTQAELRTVLGDAWLVLLPRHDALLVARDTEQNLAVLREAAAPLLESAGEH